MVHNMGLVLQYETVVRWRISEDGKHNDQKKNDKQKVSELPHRTSNIEQHAPHYKAGVLRKGEWLQRQ